MFIQPTLRKLMTIFEKFCLGGFKEKINVCFLPYLAFSCKLFAKIVLFMQKIKITVKI